MNLLIISPIAAEAVEALSARHQVVRVSPADTGRFLELLAEAEALVFRSGVQLDAGLLDAAPRLRLLVRAGSGLDNVDLAYVRRRGLHLVNVPGPGAQAVAEMAIGLILALSRHIVHAHGLLTRGVWAKDELSGHLIAGKTLGIIGLGAVGTRVAELGRTLGMTPIACIAGHGAVCGSPNGHGVPFVPFEDLFGTADVVSLHVPLTDATRHVIDAGALARMRPGALLVNLSRGGVVDEVALRDAIIRPGGLGGAALDVHEHEGDGARSPLAGLPNVILTPHIGAMALESQRAIGDRVVEIVSAFNGCPARSAEPQTEQETPA